MHFKSKFPVATLVSLVLIILTVYHPGEAEKVASVLFPIIWPLIFIAGFAAIGTLLYKSKQLKSIQKETVNTETYQHYSRRLQQTNEPS
ncbi:hypothetical protein [Pontibacter pamirensis]|uniref:hypothetical protein n=1 Tax=Pontibacter pamirensis TaxID=2562824 RepID=UPI001389CFA3|nr:hypothetical protein [Pontibacter pamirensis]